MSYMKTLNDKNNLSFVTD